MICISWQLLHNFGLTARQLELVSKMAPKTGVFPCQLYSFNGGGEGRFGDMTPQEWLLTEAEPRTLCLVAMADRYDAGRSTGANILEVAEAEKEQLLRLVQEYGWSESTMLEELLR